MKDLVIVRGGGDIATGTIYKLFKCGFKVLILEIEKPSAIRRNVAFCEAIYDTQKQVEDVTCYLAHDYNEAKQACKAVAEIDGPCYVRLGRSGVESVNGDDYKFELGKGVVLQKGEKVALVATGLMVQEALEAAKKMETAPTVVNIHTIKPIDKELIVELAKTHDTIVTCEEHSIIGGLGSAVAEVLAEAGTACKLVRVGVQDVFGESGKPAELFAKYKIDADAIVEAATK